MKAPIVEVYQLLFGYSLTTVKLYLSLTPKGQVHLCSGTLIRSPRKSIIKELETKIKDLGSKDFRFYGCSLKFNGPKFIITRLPELEYSEAERTIIDEHSKGEYFDSPTWEQAYGQTLRTL